VAENYELLFPPNLRIVKRHEPIKIKRKGKGYIDF
jgi:hypothetical protein